MKGARESDVNRETTPSAVAVASEYSIPGIGWEYYNHVFNEVAMHEAWPPGLAAHFAWAGGGQWRIVGLWDSDTSVNDFFGGKLSEAVTRAIVELGVVTGPRGAPDVQPEQSDAIGFALGPQAAKFVASSADAEGEAVRVLGTQPVLISLDMPDMTRALYRELVKALTARDFPKHLIAHFAIAPRGPDRLGVHICEVWTDHAHALAMSGSVLLPEVEKLAAAHEVDLPVIRDTFDLRRIAISEAAAASLIRR